MYQIHLTREQLFIDEEGPITLKQLLETVSNDQTLEYTNTIDYTSPFGDKITKKGGDFLLWTEPKSGVETYFEFNEGVISAIFCDETLEKMKEWVEPLNGYLHGDIGEEY